MMDNVKKSIQAQRLEAILENAVADADDLRSLLWSGIPSDADNHVRATTWLMTLGCLPYQKCRREFVQEKRYKEYYHIVQQYYGDTFSLSDLSEVSHSADKMSAGQTITEICKGNSEISKGKLEVSKGSAEVSKGSAEVSKVESEVSKGNSDISKGKSEVCQSHSSGNTKQDSKTLVDDTNLEASIDLKILRQIRVDIPRTNSANYSILVSGTIRKVMERILYCWAVRNPASGYVQGINDLLIPFLIVFLRANCNVDPKNIVESNLPSSILFKIEAESYWCLSKILSYIQINYTFEQRGIQTMISKLEDLIRKIDEQLYLHLLNQGVNFLQISFRWMNCLLIREIPLTPIIRLWDTYIAEGVEGFCTFHIYVCTVFLVYWSSQLKCMDFQNIMLFIQKLPTTHWGIKEIESLISEAYVLKCLYHDSPQHLLTS